MRRIGVTTAVLLAALAIAGVALRTQSQEQVVHHQTQAGAAQAQVATVNVPEMDCAGCEIGVKIAAGKVNGVTDVKTSSETRTAEVTFDASKTNASAIANAITQGTGFKTEVLKSGKKT